MKTIFNYLVFFTISFLGLIGCGDSNKVHHSSGENLEIWADTIIYEVLISNPDTLNKWETAKLKNVRHRKLVDDLFEMIYTGKKKAYDYYTHQALSIDEIKDLEADDRFSREKVGKLQFTETWIYNKSIQKLNKNTHAILLAYELYDDSDNLRGYKAAFFVKDF